MKYVLCLTALAISLTVSTLALRAEEPVVVQVNCLCKLGGPNEFYSARMAVDAGSRPNLKALIERNVFGLGKTLVLRGDGCGRDGKLSGMDARCGDFSVSTRNANGTFTRASFPNSEFSGDVTIQVTANGGIPRIPNTPDDQPKVDDERWNSRYISAISVMGKATRVTPK